MYNSTLISWEDSQSDNPAQYNTEEEIDFGSYKADRGYNGSAPLPKVKQFPQKELGTTKDTLKHQRRYEEYEMASFMPILVFIFLFLANRGIQKDEKLIKSMDRLR